MPLNKMIKKSIVSCTPATPVEHVARLMKTHEIGAILVTETNLPVGIITDRDLALRCLADSANVSLLTAEDVMSTSVETVPEEEGIYTAVQAMKSAGVRRVVIVNELGEPTALLSFDDVFELLAEEMAALKEVIQPRRTKLENVA